MRARAPELRERPWPLSARAPVVGSGGHGLVVPGRGLVNAGGVPGEAASGGGTSMRRWQARSRISAGDRLGVSVEEAPADRRAVVRVVAIGQCVVADHEAASCQ